MDLRLGGGQSNYFSPPESQRWSAGGSEGHNSLGTVPHEQNEKTCTCCSIPVQVSSRSAGDQRHPRGRASWLDQAGQASHPLVTSSEHLLHPEGVTQHCSTAESVEPSPRVFIRNVLGLEDPFAHAGKSESAL